MSEQQHDMFANDPQLSQLLDHIDKVPVGDIEHDWPQSLVCLIDVMEAELTRQHVDLPRESARKIALCLSHYMGGRAYYFPQGVRMVNAIRDDKIYVDFNGRNIEQLRQRYKLSQPQIYTIIKQQRQINTRRNQPDLF